MSESFNGRPRGHGVILSDSSEQQVASNSPRLLTRHRPGRWFASAVAFVLLAMFVHFLVTSPTWGWPVVRRYLFNDQVMGGLRNTIGLTFAASALGLVLGLITVTMRMSANLLLRILAAVYIWVIRAIPALVLLLLIFFAGALLPTLSIGIPFGASFFTMQTNQVLSLFGAAVIGLGLYLGAYSGEIFRGGVLSVPAGQHEAAKALGMSDALMMRRIIMPQAIRVIIPALANELITMFKNTSLVTVIGYTELLTTVQLIYAINFETIPLLVVACIWYLVLASVAMFGQRKLEQRFGRGFDVRRTRRSLRTVLAEQW